MRRAFTVFYLIVSLLLGHETQAQSQTPIEALIPSEVISLMKNKEFSKALSAQAAHVARLQSNAAQPRELARAIFGHAMVHDFAGNPVAAEPLYLDAIRKFELIAARANTMDIDLANAYSSLSQFYHAIGNATKRAIVNARWLDYQITGMPSPTPLPTSQ